MPSLFGLGDLSLGFMAYLPAECSECELPFGDHEAGEDEDGGEEPAGDRSFFKKSVAQFEKDLITKALRDAAGNRSKAAEMLGIYRRLLYAKIKEYGLEGYPPKGR